MVNRICTQSLPSTLSYWFMALSKVQPEYDVAQFSMYFAILYDVSVGVTEQRCVDLRLANRHSTPRVVYSVRANH